MEQSEKIYENHEVTKMLGIGSSTSRKWCIILERNGYKFVKGARDSRLFLEHDLQALFYFKQLTKTEKHNKEEAALIVTEKYSRTTETGRTTPVPAKNSYITFSEETLNQLLDQSKRQDEFNKSLLSKLELQENYIKESLKKKDKILLECIRLAQRQV